MHLLPISPHGMQVLICVLVPGYVAQYPMLLSETQNPHYQYDHLEGSLLLIVVAEISLIIAGDVSCG